MRNSEKISQTFNGRVQWEIAGNYFKLMGTVSPVTVELYNRSERVHFAQNVEGGHYQRIDFDRVAITTAGNEAVSWLYAPHEGGSDRLTGAVSITGTVDVGDRAARILGVPYGSLAAAFAQAAIGGVNALVSSDRGYVPGANFASVTALGATTNETVVAPASNTNGMIVWCAGINTQNTADATVTQVSLLAKTSAPGGGADGELILTATHLRITGAASGQGKGYRERARFIAAGKGLYFRNSSATAESSGSRFVDYTLL